MSRAFLVPFPVSFCFLLLKLPCRLHTDIDLPSPIMVPTLHVLFLQLIPLTIVPRSYPYLPPNPLSISDIRDELIAWIADQALAGDRMTAEWILLCVIARVSVFLDQLYA